MNISFDEKVALVTGAGSGLGLATANAFAAAGASVALADADEQAADAAAEELTARGHQALAIRCDVADDAQVQAMVERTVAAFGRLDAAYNNAGVQNVAVEAAESTRGDFDRVGDSKCRTLALQLRSKFHDRSRARGGRRLHHTLTVRAPIFSSRGSWFCFAGDPLALPNKTERSVHHPEITGPALSAVAQRFHQ